MERSILAGDAYEMCAVRCGVSKNKPDCHVYMVVWQSYSCETY